MKLASNKPEPNRGAELINEKMMTLPEEQRMVFLNKAAETAEGLFSTGMISEREFREALDHIAAVIAVQ